MAGGTIYRDLVRVAAGAFRRPPRTAQELAEIQSRRLQDLLQYVSRFSPYYRELLAGLKIDAAELRSEADLARLPVLEKSTARERMSDLVSREADLHACGRRHTSGTTGTPLALPERRLETLLSNVLWARCYMDAGFKPWRRQAKIAFSHRIPARPYLAQRLGLFRRDYIASTAPPETKIEALRRIAPDTLVSWATMLDEITAHLERTDAYVEVPRVFSTANQLWPEVRRRTEERLRARVTDLYGAAETGPVAWECERHDGYHVHSDQVVVELLDDNDRPAQTGRMVCTVLWRRTLPLIRYAIGDSAEWAEGPCPCGRPYPLLKSVTGRVTELVLLPDGSRINSVTLRAAVLGKPGVEQYQLVQETPVRFRLRVVAGAAFTPGVEQSILEAFRRQFGGALDLRVARVDRIRNPTGSKFTAMVTLEQIARLRAQGVDVGVFAPGAE